MGAIARQERQIGQRQEALERYQAANQREFERIQKLIESNARAIEALTRQRSD
ncbi:MAG: hypothetical protein AAGB13_12835 [Cyanobacteria bacterium P01_F01_bin.33]